LLFQTGQLACRYDTLRKLVENLKDSELEMARTVGLCTLNQVYP
jgi:hypothetical protein